MDKRFQLFVSSTYADLKEERRAVIQALMEMDCIPAGMELFPAADEEQFQFIKSVINDCDYYVLIVGGRYGSTAKDGMSYTEKEYEYAKSIGVKVLSFLHESPSDIPLGKSELDPAQRARLDDFRTKIKSNTLVKLWSKPSELPGLVALSLSKTIKSHPAVGWVRANQLANAEVLNDLNELRKQNVTLIEEQRRLLAELANAHPKLSDLAQLDEAYEITGHRKLARYSQEFDWKFSITWGDLFSELGTYILAHPNDSIMKSKFDQVVDKLYRKHHADHDDYNRYSVDTTHFQTTKVQFMALNLADISMREATGGAISLF